MGVNVDEPGRDQAIGRIDLGAAGSLDTPVGGVDDLDDAVTDDADIGHPRRGTRAIDDRAVPDDDVVVHAASYELGNSRPNCSDSTSVIDVGPRV